MNKIFTFGDGYATGHIWPEWPQILQALLPEYVVVNNAGIGAGPEWLVNQFVKEIPNISKSTVIFQWPQSNRLDKLIEDDTWQKVADSDPVYYFNQYDSWWLSSASKQDEVVKYHTTFIQPKQHSARLATYKTLVKNTLQNKKCNYLYISTDSQRKFSLESRFTNTRQQEIQPSPNVHFAYVIEVILARLLHLPVDTARIKELEHRINQHKWVAYDPDRAEIWQKISAI